MSGIACLHCTAETTNGLALCETCRAAASVYLEYLPVYFRNLARWRPGRAGSRDVPGSREPRRPSEGSPDRVMRALDQAGNALESWAKMLTEERGIVPPVADDEAAQVAALCRWLSEHLTSIATTDWAGDFMCSHFHGPDHQCDGIGHHEKRLQGLTLDVIPGWYAGECAQSMGDDETCGTLTFVVPGLSWVTCGGCGTTTYARDHLPTIITEARAWIAPPKAIASALVAMLDTEESVPRLHDRIRKWESLGTLTPIRKYDHHGEPVGIKRYRLGDVLDRATGHAGGSVVAMRAKSA